VTRPTLSLLHGDVTIALSGRAVAIGRLPECDVMLDGWEVSRRHARIIPTPAGPLIVDRSRFGTFVNQSQVIAPLLLTEGDVIRVGRNELRVVVAPVSVLRPVHSGLSDRLANSWRRYAVSEIGGAVAALVGALWALRAGGGIPLAALAGTLAEILWFYGSLAVRDLRYEANARAAVSRKFDRHAARDVLQNLAREFGAAEAVDLLVRPVCLGAGLATIGGALGVLVGKLVADILFYGPVLSLCHWRFAGRAPRAAEPHRLRQTMAVPMPVGQLADLHRQLDTQDATPHPELPPSHRADR
jgi:pSer/pThr/pTyr-binding forkhead associated (FHA) protein